MPTTLLLALPLILRPFYGPNECSELTPGTVDCPKKMWRQAYMVGLICPLPTLIRIGLIYLPKNCGYGTAYPSAFPALLRHMYERYL